MTAVSGIEKDIYEFGEIWPDWKICELLGKGSFGKVYRAERNDLTGIRQVAAVKQITIPSKTAAEEMANDSPEAKRRATLAQMQALVNELNMMIRLCGHRNIVRYEEHRVIPSQDGLRYDLFLRMELLTSLENFIKRNNGGKVTRETAVRLGLDMAEALRVMHEDNLIHRDLKPANVFVDEHGVFKLGDFGTARAMSSDGMASTHVGTMNYMAPEVSRMDRHYDCTVDYYSLGIMLYRMMNRGWLPFTSAENNDKERAMIRRRRGDAMEPPCDADPMLARIILKCCAYEADQRYQFATDLIEDLKRCRDAQMHPAFDRDGETVPPGHADPEPDRYEPPQYMEEPVAPMMPGLDAAHNPLAPAAWSPFDQLRNGVQPVPPVMAVNAESSGNWSPVPMQQQPAQHVFANPALKSSPAPVPQKPNPAPAPQVEKVQVHPVLPASVTPAQAQMAPATTGMRAGDVVAFGRYPQSIPVRKNEEILWQVLDTVGNCALLLSANCLDTCPYQGKVNQEPFSASSLRKWLAKDFMSYAFNAAERSAILPVSLENGRTEQLLILSRDELACYLTPGNRMVCAPSAFAVKHLPRAVGKAMTNARWWLRRKDPAGGFEIVDENGQVSACQPNDKAVCVRPAMWVNLTSGLLKTVR